MRTFAWFSLPTLLALNKVPNYWTGKIAEDERVVFFPTTASKVNSTHWEVPIHGWIFEPETESKKRKALINILGKMFQLKDAEEKKFLNQRIRPFTVDNKSMKYVNIKIGDSIHRMPRSLKDGHFRTNFTLHESHLNSENGTVPFKVVGQDRSFQGTVHLVPPEGISIVSDIDDTVKITNYLDKKEFYKNTFLKEFQAVPGMAQYFHKCKSQYENCCFHFVSASPYQLFEQLSDFFQLEGFPLATFHLKRIRVKDKTLLQLFADPQDYKIRQIEPLLKTFPNRKFIFIGDSGEKDPEIYTELFQKYPSQIDKVLIRNVNNATAARMSGIHHDKWQYFNDGT
eukprot:CAMPEP_0195531754 /NCGR_PEP_ID=MMETSP0794_2-20130614/36254_1 /TAXON_ID=515487 /ORGANISM="Stephanopyxis turris, Strain CCMP 815" /LENGTH=340 /DNA_ID=CAMNT_0040663673 /DNA_START=109 /DNA_END=1127 /DNA_ORIENTATION=-